jgi:hypothetical protein
MLDLEINVQLAPPIRIMICHVGQSPIVQCVNGPFGLAKRILDGAYIQALPLEDGVTVYCDEDALGKDLPLNREIPARMPEIPDGSQVIYMDENSPAPGEMGVHRIHGAFVLVRHGDGDHDYADLTDDDIAKYTALFKESA